MKRINAGISKISDIFNVDTNQFFSFEEINYRNPGCFNWLEYAGLIAAIPQDWRFYFDT